MSFLRVVLPKFLRSASTQQLNTLRDQYGDLPYDEMREAMDLIYTTEAVSFLEKKADVQALKVLERIKTKVRNVALEEAKNAGITCDVQGNIIAIQNSIERGLTKKWRKEVLAFYDLSDDDFAELKELHRKRNRIEHPNIEERDVVEILEEWRRERNRNKEK
ncbi:hypothetical protein BGZ80_007098 [Entomortierella chlamydospora]|uniref:Uncharacterized protein n=1 Tax=Entomortierella chlamydospora TaxID=101097 RepID=A0A9P6T1N5_9FUNG|nr:hypothetical protein BGZ79_004649 [Entomortierella chlamydospora]KAG0018487.1 hypothetical protein BGZ80_007098 [Entomortierella chlamydospora]